MRPAFVHEDEPLGRNRCGYHHPPGGPQEPVALGGRAPPFFLVGPILAMARHIVERLTERAVTASMYSQRSRRLTNGRSVRSSSKSFIAFSSSFGADPGLLLGASEPPSSASMA